MHQWGQVVIQYLTSLKDNKCQHIAHKNIEWSDIVSLRIQEEEKERGSHSRTRSALVKMYGRCHITGWSNPVEYQCAHIIPKSIGYNIGYQAVNTIDNCILLANGLHSLFDDMEWTIDIYSFLDFGVQDQDWFQCKLLVYRIPKYGSSVLCDYVNRIVRLPIRYIPALYIHYLVYLQYNYSRDGKATNPNSSTGLQYLEKLYKQALQRGIYQHLLKVVKQTSCIRQFFLERRCKKRQALIITDSRQRDRDIDREYKVIWDYWSESYSSWETKSTLPNELVNEYHQYQAVLDDPDWVEGES
jgi:hypothetical protein